jgi:hypothetical protein
MGRAVALTNVGVLVVIPGKLWSVSSFLVLLGKFTLTPISTCCGTPGTSSLVGRGMA